MIVREIKQADDEFFKSFDYFNDFDDTLAWAKRNCPEKVSTFEEHFARYLQEHNRKILNKE